MTRRALIVGAALAILGTGAWGVELPPVSLDPMVAWVQLGAGGTHSGTFAVTNRGEKAITLNVLLLDFLLDETGGFVTLAPGTLGERSLALHIVYSPERMTLEAGETGTVRYSFALPPEAVGPRWATLIVTPESPEEVAMEPGAGDLAFIVRLEVNYAFTIIQRVPNPPRPAGQVVGMNVSGARAEDGTRQVTVEVAFQNLAEDVAWCTVYFEIRDPAGATLARHEVPRERVVLPRALRVFSHTFEGLAMPPGQYLILAVVDFGGDTLTAGQFVATVRE